MKYVKEQTVCWEIKKSGGINMNGKIVIGTIVAALLAGAGIVAAFAHRKNNGLINY